MVIIRIKAFLAFFTFLMIGMVVLYFSIKEIIGYFYFHNLIVYSWMDCFAFFFSIVIFLFSIYPAHIAFYGVPIAEKKSKSVYKMVLFFFIVSLIVPILFSLTYIKKIESKGYIKCQGIPSGWMPGMATKYAINEVLCTKKDP